jgi:hypothetical protein
MSILETRRRVRELPGQTAPPTAPIAAEPEPKFEVSTSREFESWLTEQRINLAFTTYQVGKLFFLGIGAARRLSVFNRTLGPCMGLAYGDGALLGRHPLSGAQACRCRRPPALRWQL